MADPQSQHTGAEPGGSAALLVVVPDVHHQAPPLKVELQLRRARELLRHALPPPRALQYLGEHGVLLGVTALLDPALLSSAQELSRALLSEPDLGFRLGIHTVQEPASPSALELRQAQQVAMAQPLGGVGLSADAVDVLQRAWALPLRDLGHLPGAEDALGLRVFALEAEAPPAALAPPALHALLAVLAPQIAGRDARAAGIAELIADTLVVGLSRSALLKVVSRESLRRLRDPARAERDAFEHLGAAHVLRGRASLGMRGAVFVHFELMARDQALPIWAERVSLSLEELLYGESEPLATVVRDVHSALLNEFVNVSQWVAWQHLENYQLLGAATQLMHRMSPAGFARSRELLDEVIQRLPQAAEPHAWLARWHLGAASQGLQLPRQAATAARDACARALERDPLCALALTLDGYAMTMQGAGLGESGPRHQAALRANANEAQAWLWTALHQTYQGQNAQATEAIGVALALSPLDPWHFIFDDVASHVYLAGGHLDLALAHAQAALRVRAQHAPSLCNLAVIQALRGAEDEARDAMARLLKQWPHYSMALFRERYPGLHAQHAQAYINGLRIAGMPP